jgi:hypothetical protein
MKTILVFTLIVTMSLVGYARQIYQNNVPDYLKKMDAPIVVQHRVDKLPMPSNLDKENFNNDTSGFAKAPLMVLKINTSGKLVKSFPSLDFLKQEDIASMEILPDKKADSLYGARGKHGVIIIALVPTVKTYTMQQYLEHYNISRKNRQLPIYLDYNLLSNTDGMLITKGDTKTVTVEKTSDGKQYINILSNHYPNLRVHLRNDAEEHKEWGKGLK